MNRQLLLAAAGFFLLLPTAFPALAEDPSAIRTWTSKSGSQIMAKLVSIKAQPTGTVEDVVLESSEGRRVTVPQSDLSPTDQQWLERHKGWIMENLPKDDTTGETGPAGTSTAHSLSSASDPAAPRIWTARSGGQVIARLVGLTTRPAGVVLEKADGSRSTVPKNELSEMDYQWLGNHYRWINEHVPKNDTTGKARPATSASDPSTHSFDLPTGPPNDAELAHLRKILDKGLAERLSLAETEEATAIFTRLMPAKLGAAEHLRWEVIISPATRPGADAHVSISVEAFPKAGGGAARSERLVWSHISYHTKAPDTYGTEKWGDYPVMRSKDHSLFVLIGRIEVRLVSDHKSYKSDAKLEALVKGMNLKKIQGL